MIKKLINKYKVMSEDVKCSIYYIICNLFQKGIAFVTVPIFTRVMSTEQYGQFSVFQSWIQIFIIFTSLNIAYGILNKALTKYEKKDEYVSSIQILYTIITIIFALVYYIAKYFFGNFLNIPIWIELLMFIELIVTPAMNIFTVANRYFLKYKISVSITIALTILNPVLGIIFVLNSSDKGIARIASYLIAQIIIALPIYIYNLYKGKKGVNKEYWKYTIAFSLPLLPYFISTMILNQSDKIMISSICGNSYAGVYSIAYSIAMLVKIFNESINASFIPWLYKKIKNKDLGKVKAITNRLILIIGILNVLLMLFTPEVIRIVASEKYLKAMYIMPLLTFSVSLIFEISLFNNIEIYYEKNKIIMTSSIIISLLNIGLNYIGINLFGYLAAAYTTALCYIILLAWHMFYCKRAIKHISTLIEYKKIIIINCIIVLFGIISMLAYRYILLRSILFVVLFTCFAFLIKKVIGGINIENKN